MREAPILAVIGGSGLYQFEDLKNFEVVDTNTPFGKPSAPITLGNLMGRPVAFLSRHGVGHTISPSEVPYRANIFALKALGVQRIVSVSACGSLRESYAPGHIIIPNQIFDFTHKRERSFFGKGLVAHVSVADPYCKSLSDLLEEAIKSLTTKYHRGGTYITIEGPRFSTKGESGLYRQWGMDIIGMTAAPEAFLAREAEICYTTMAHVTDYDVWHINEETVSVDMVIRTLSQNISLAQETIRKMIMMIDDSIQCDCQNALQNALITDKNHIDPEKKQQLEILTEKYLD